MSWVGAGAGASMKGEGGGGVRNARKRGEMHLMDLQDSNCLLLARLATAVKGGKAVRQVRGQAGDGVVRRTGTSERLDRGRARDAGHGAGARRGEFREGARRIYLAAVVVAVDMGRRVREGGRLQLQQGREGRGVGGEGNRLTRSVVCGHRWGWGLARTTLGAHLFDTDNPKLGAPRSGGGEKRGGRKGGRYQTEGMPRKIWARQEIGNLFRLLKAPHCQGNKAFCAAVQRSGRASQPVHQQPHIYLRHPHTTPGPAHPSSISLTCRTMAPRGRIVSV